MQALTLIIPRPPVPKGRPRVYKGHGVTPERTRREEQAIRDLFRDEYPDFTPLTGRLLVTCQFWMPRSGRPDVDNLLKLVTDALNGLAYEDDEQIELLMGIRHLPDRKVPGRNGALRWRRAGDPLTCCGEPYEPHTSIRIEETISQKGYQS
ncbi:MAG: RusA family crossover junction endodeoxyribonuclease [Bifidobacterium choerinum]